MTSHLILGDQQHSYQHVRSSRKQPIDRQEAPQRVPLMIIPFFLTDRAGFFLRGLALRMNLRLNLDNALRRTDIGVSPERYLIASFINCSFFFLFFSLFFSLLFFLGRDISLLSALLLGIIIATVLTLFIFAVLLHYPQIIAGKKAEQIDKTLIFAVKDILLQVSSGVPLSQALTHVARAQYGVVSEEFAEVVRQVSIGKSLEQSLESLAARTRSSYLKRTCWQMHNALRSGSSMKSSLQVIITELVKDQRARIEIYAKELNLWSLVYMMFAVAIPSISATMLVILSSFAGFGITRASFIGFLGVTVFVQIALIGFIKTRRPVVSL